MEIKRPRANLRALVETVNDPEATEEQRQAARLELARSGRRDFAYPGQRRRPAGVPGPERR